jgi:hypothetical protein
MVGLSVRKKGQPGAYGACMHRVWRSVNSIAGTNV